MRSIKKSSNSLSLDKLSEIFVVTFSEKKFSEFKTFAKENVWALSVVEKTIELQWGSPPQFSRER